MLARSYLDCPAALLAYSPMLHARLFARATKYRSAQFQPRLDGSPPDRPLFVQFCANEPDELLAAARLVAPYCDAVDLNLGCPQAIARRGHYGAFLQDDWPCIAAMVRCLHDALDVPVTAKLRVLDTPERTLAYARAVLDAGASILAVHGRRRDQKGHNTGLADWSVLRYLRDHLPPDTVLFANGNVLQHADLARCLAATGADAVLSAEGSLHDPTIFAPPPAAGAEGVDYWRARDGRGGFRVDAVMRRYLDLVHRYAAAPGCPPQRLTRSERRRQPPPSVSVSAMQAHLFALLHALLAEHHDIRTALARCHTGDTAAFEHVFHLVQAAVRTGIQQYQPPAVPTAGPVDTPDPTSSRAAVERCRRPWWVCQPAIRPLPSEAVERGAMRHVSS